MKQRRGMFQNLSCVSWKRIFVHILWRTRLSPTNQSFGKWNDKSINCCTRNPTSTFKLAIYSLLSHHSPRHPQPMPYNSRWLIGVPGSAWWSLMLLPCNGQNFTFCLKKMKRRNPKWWRFGRWFFLFKAGCFIRFQSLVFRKEPTCHKTPLAVQEFFWTILVTFSDSSGQKRKAGLFCNEFSTEANWSAGQVEAPNGGEDDLDTQTAAVSHRSLTDMHQNNTIALPVWPREMRFCPHQHQQSDAWLLCTNEWKARAATTEISLPKHENCCLFHRHEVVTT